MSDWAILGCGYVGARLARALLDEGGHRVRVAARNTTRLQPLGDHGAEVHALDAAKSRAFGPALYGLSSPIVIYSIPPLATMPSGEPVRRAADAAGGVGASRFIYLSSTAVYGETPDGEVVDEETQIALGDPEAMTRIGEESAVEMARLAGLRTVVLRLAAIYGPGRGVRERLKAGSYKLIDEGMHHFSRVHVDDIVGIIRASVTEAPPGAVYCVGDDKPTTQREYSDWLVARLGVAPPSSVASLAPGKPRRAVRNRQIANAKLKRELSYAFKYPSYVEGEAAIEAEAAAAPVANVPVAIAHVGSAPVGVPVAIAHVGSAPAAVPVAVAHVGSAPVADPVALLDEALAHFDADRARARAAVERARDLLRQGK